MTVTKADLAIAVYRNGGLTRQESVFVVEALLEITKHTLETGEYLLISGFGKFSVRIKGMRRGRNPQTGNDIAVRARRLITFKASGVLRRKLNPLKKGH